VYLSTFVFDDVRQLPSTGSKLSLIKYCVTVILDLAVFSVFAFTNIYLFRKNFSGPDNSNGSDQQTTKKQYFAVICFAIIAAKIIFSVLSGIISAVVRMLKADPSSILPWVILFFF
jgi:hypothetical protein